MPIYNGRTRISDENIWRVVDIKTTTVTPALYENLEENIKEDLQIGDFVLEITEVNQYISDDDILDNKINNINIPNGEIRKTYAVVLSKENYNKLQYLTGFTTNTSYSTLGSLRNDINNLETNIVYLIQNNNKYDEYILAGSGNNKELVKIGDTNITFDSSNLVDVSEFLQLRADLKQSHDELSNRISSNAANISSNAANISENANNIQNLANETLSIKNDLNDVEADMTTLTREIWGSDTTTGDSRIDTLEETTQKKERVEIDYLDMGTTTTPDYYNVVNKNGNSFSITYKTSENGASSTIENIKKAPMNVYSTILNGVSYVMQRIIIGDKTYTRYLNVSSNTTSPWMAEPVVTNTVTNTPNKIPTSQAVVDYVPTNISSFNNDSGYLTAHQDITGKEDKSNKVTTWNNTPSNDNYPSEKLVKDSLDNKASTDNVNSLSSNLSTIYNFIYNLTTDKVYDNGNLTNIGTTPHSTQELVNSNIDSQLGTIDSQLNAINEKVSDLSENIDEKVLDLSELELIDSTHSLASNANWTGTSTRLTSLTKGTRILYRITYVPTATSQGASLSIQFTDNTHSGYKGIIFADGTRSYAKWFISSIAKNDVLLLEYDGTNWVLLDFFAIGERPKVARTGSYNDLSDKPTIVDNLNSTSSTSVLSAKQGKALADLIGDAITYINQ